MLAIGGLTVGQPPHGGHEKDALCIFGASSFGSEAERKALLAFAESVRGVSQVAD
jgi:hypothetical protein